MAYCLISLSKSKSRLWFYGVSTSIPSHSDPANALSPCPANTKLFSLFIDPFQFLFPPSGALITALFIQGWYERHVHYGTEIPENPEHSLHSGGGDTAIETNHPWYAENVIYRLSPTATSVTEWMMYIINSQTPRSTNVNTCCRARYWYCGKSCYFCLYCDGARGRSCCISAIGALTSPIKWQWEIVARDSVLLLE